MIQLIYERDGVTYDHLRFNSVRFMRAFMARMGEIKVIAVREVSR